MPELAFTKYRKEEDKTKILLMYLILNNYDLSKVERVEEVIQEQMFDTEFRKIYGITSEFVDTARIDKELLEIRTPVVYSPQSYEMYSNEKTIYSYRAKNKEMPLYINDLSIISPLMIITENCVVSSNLASPIEKTSNIGFMFFSDYVLHGKCVVGNWTMTYKDKEFCVYYTSEKDGEKKSEKLYHALELAQTSTYRLVLYIIKKVVQDSDTYHPDNFETDTWELISK